MCASHAHVNVECDGANIKTTFLLRHGAVRKPHFASPMLGADLEAQKLCV